jgi:mannosyl-oligosaccharide alpha-1,2-mannosidase
VRLTAIQQYVLLGGLEPKYRKMHVRVVEAVKKWLLYRPMVKDGRDLLFSAKVSTQGNPDTDLTYEYEVTHLTCFLGGMFGLGGKLFDRPDDVEIAKKLADGCVWAYESMPSGIMPEGSMVVPCKSMDSCPWNETTWHEHLDPSSSWRDQEVIKWEEMEREKKAKYEIELKQQEERLRIEKARQEAADAADEERYDDGTLNKGDLRDAGNSTKGNGGEGSKAAKATKSAYPRPEPGNDAPTKTGDSKPAKEEHAGHTHAKRDALPPPPPATPAQGSAEDAGSAGKASAQQKPAEGDDYRKPAAAVEEESNSDLKDKLDLNRAETGGTGAGAGKDTGTQTEKPAAEKTATEKSATEGKPEDKMASSGGVVGQVALIEAQKPMSHKEFVAQKITNERLPPGFVRIDHRRYILRYVTYHLFSPFFPLDNNQAWVFY